jgi:ATP-binding cassette, subfamily B, bacterial MsbA
MRHLKDILTFGRPYLRRYWVRLALGIFLGVLFGLSNASFVWASRTVFERLSPPTEAKAEAADTGTAPSWLRSIGASVESAVDPWLPRMGRPLDWRQMAGGFFLLPFLVGLRSFLGYASTYCMCWVSQRMIYDLRYDVLAQLYRQSLDFFNRSAMGDLITRINYDTAMLHKAMTNGLSDIIKEPFTVAAVLVALGFVNWKLTLLAVVFLPLCSIPLVVLGRKVRRAAKASVAANVSQASLLIEALAGIRVVKAFGLESRSLERFVELSRKIIHHDMKSVQARELVNPLVETISMLGLGLLVVFIFATRTNVPDLVSFMTGVTLMFTPFKKLASVHVMFQQASVGVERLAQVMHAQPSVQEAVQPAALKAFGKEIRFDRVHAAYGETQVLQELSLTIPRGYKLGVAGESGSGKSTLVNLLFRFYDPTQGTITLDGVNVREVSLADLRAQMALVSQEIVLFDMTVAENIACGKPDATRAEIEAAARAAYAHDFIMQLPQGYDTRIAERGENLSGGQRQRLCIARAFVRNAPILVLDEATSALDSQAEAEVQAAIERLEENRTVICVAHRLSTLRNMDRIIVLARGRIAEEGTFDELLRRGGVFADMARRQGIQPGGN